MNYGMGQRINPHSLRVGIVDFSSSSLWIDDSRKTEDTIMSHINQYNSLDSKSGLYLKHKLSGISICILSLFERKIKLERILGKSNYSKMVNKIKVLSR